MSEHRDDDKLVDLQSGSIFTAMVGGCCLLFACCIMAIAYMLSVGGAQ